MAKYTIIQADGVVGVDGKFHKVDLSSLDPAIHALQFNTVSGKGHIEFGEDAEGRRAPNQELTDFTPFMPYIQAWEVIENTPEPEPEPETPEQTRARLEAELDYHLDVVARSYGYRSVDALLGYVNSTNPTWNSQANAFSEFRDAFWLGAIQIQNDVKAGLRPVPTSAEMVAELPKFEEYLGAVDG